MAARLASLPLDKALKIGNGKQLLWNSLIRTAITANYLSTFSISVKKMLRWCIFLLPVRRFGKENPTYFMFKNMEQFNEVLGGKLSGNARLNLCSDKNAEEMLRAHINAASKIGVRGTPLLYIKASGCTGL